MNGERFLINGQEIFIRGVVGEIVEDISGTVRTFPKSLDIDTETLVNGFLGNLALKTREIHENLSQAFLILNFLEGRHFETLSEQEKRGRIYEISSDDPEILNRRLENYYKEFLFENHPVNAWEKFVKACQVFKASIDQTGVSADFPCVFELTRLDLPRLSPDTRISRNDRYLANTALATFMALAIGMFSKNETWSDFLERPEIVVVEPANWQKFHKIRKEQPAVIVGQQRGVRGPDGKMLVCYRGVPYYFSAPAKYPNTYVEISLRTDLEDFNDSLANMLDQGKAFPLMAIDIPTEVMREEITGTRNSLQ